ncbi:CDP-glycerol glycerophosphotransferase family protein [Microbacterium sp.]|uniref:CDP-glycerol glycerophosphotransferase family protein n=1 Tax=Microbacterium sp. TaxID=51671 RepID=UPI003A8490D0
MASFSFRAGNAGKLLRIPLYAAGWLATAFIPRAPDRWVFGSAVGVADGALALWRAGADDPRRAVWLTADAGQDADAAAAGIPTVRKSSLRGFWLTARAGVTVITHGFGDVNRYAATGGFVVQLWHGIPLKRLGLDSAATTRSPLRVLEPLVRRLYRRTQRRIRLVPAASHLVRGRLESAFGLGDRRVPVTGEPRTDVLCTGSGAERRSAARAGFSRVVPLSPRTRVVLYAPTWRDGAADPAVPTPEQWHALAAILEEQDAVLLLRSHPLGSGAAASPTSRARMLGSDLIADVTPLLPGVDVLITDYSSLIFDSALVPGPVVLLAPDLEEYERDRGFYGTYADVSAGEHAIGWDQATAQLHAVLSDPAERARRSARASALSERVHEFRDGRSAARVLERIRVGSTAGGRP